ncbi:hypothetical protein [Bradyrhizobium sp. RDI18]
MKKISLSIAAVALLAIPAATGAVAAELPAFEKGGLSGFGRAGSGAGR